MYSALEGVDEVVESFSQSLSSFRLPVEGHEEKPSAESGLLAEMNKPKKKNETGGQTQEHGQIRRHAHTRCTHARCGTRSDSACCRTLTSRCAHACAAVQLVSHGKSVQPSKAKSVLSAERQERQRCEQSVQSRAASEKQESNESNTDKGREGVSALSHGCLNGR